MSSLKSTAIYLPGLLIPRAMSLALVIVMTHFLPKSDYGLLTLVITVGELIDTSLTTWVRLALLRLGSGGTISRNLAAVVLKVVILTTGAGCVISFAISFLLIGKQFLTFWTAVATYTVGISLLRFGLTLLQSNNRSVTFSVLEIARALMSFTLATSVASFVSKSFLWPSLAVSLTTCVFAMFAIQLGLRGLPASETKYRLRDITGFAGPLLILSVLTITANAMDRLFLQYYWAAAAVGAYAATYALARQPVDVLANAINTGGYPALVARYESGGRQEAAIFLKEQFGFFLKFIIPVIAVLFLIRVDIISTVLPHEYREQAAGIFGVVLLAATAYNLRSAIFDNVFLVEQRNYLQLRYFVPVFIIGVALGVTAIPRLGVLGSALVFLCWTTLAMLMSALTGRKLIPISLSATDAIHTGILSLAACLCAGAAQFALRDAHPLLRLAAEAVAAALGYGAAMALLYPASVRQAVRKVSRAKA